jgi:DNA-binding PadR family transcriptional regulator
MVTKDLVPDGRLSPVTLQILLALVDNNRHGYGIKLEVEQRTEGTMNLGSGTLYEAIQRLEAVGYISEAAAPAGATGRARKRRYYRLEGPGRRVLGAELAHMEKTVRYAKRKKLIPHPS